MLGIEDKWVAAAYILCVASTVLCVLYSLVTWNRGEEKPQQKAKGVRWAEEEKKMEDNM